MKLTQKLGVGFFFVWTVCPSGLRDTDRTTIASPCSRCMRSCCTVNGKHALWTYNLTRSCWASACCLLSCLRGTVSGKRCWDGRPNIAPESGPSVGSSYKCVGLAFVYATSVPEGNVPLHTLREACTSSSGSVAVCCTPAPRTPRCCSRTKFR